MVLPLTEIEPPAEGESVWSVVSENYGQLSAFFISFSITMAFWRRHHRSCDGLENIDRGLMFLTLLWLGLIVLFQVPVKLLGNDTNLEDGSVTLYVAYLAVLAFETLAISMYLRRHPELLSKDHYLTSRMEKWGVVSAAYMALAAIVSIWSGTVGLIMLLGIVVIRQLESRDMKRHQAIAE